MTDRFTKKKFLLEVEENSKRGTYKNYQTDTTQTFT